jgi:hypothetical protein
MPAKAMLDDEKTMPAKAMLELAWRSTDTFFDHA